LTLFVIAPTAGRLSDRIGNRSLLGAGLTLQAVGLGWVALTIAGGHSYVSAIAAFMIAGCGTSMALPAGQNAVMSAVARTEVGKASGVFNTARQLGGAFGVAILAAVFAANGSYAGPEAFRAGVGPAVGVAAGLSALGAIAATFVRGRPVLPAHVAAPPPVMVDAVAK
jgi:MFS family permease